MKRPLSVIIITKDPRTMRETHNRVDVQTSHPKLSLHSILVKALFTSQL